MIGHPEQNNIMIMNTDLGTRQLIVLLSYCLSCVILDNFLDLSEPWFSYL